LNLFLAPEALPFTIALVLMVFIAILEVVSLLLAASPSAALDNLLPDVGENGLDGILGWLHLGKVPSLVLLLLFLMSFALFGYALQWIIFLLFNHFLAATIAAFIAFPIGIIAVRLLGAVVGRLIPYDESSAISEQSLLGLTGVVSQGVAQPGLAAQARVRDHHGRTHYLLVEPDTENEHLDEGTPILIVRKTGAIWRCIRNPHPDLLC